MRKHTCTTCSKPISSGNTTGYCRICVKPYLGLQRVKHLSMERGTARRARSEATITALNGMTRLLNGYFGK